MLDASLLLSCWDDLNKRSASGVDKETVADYEQDLIGNIVRLREGVSSRLVACYEARTDNHLADSPSKRYSSMFAH